MISVKIFHLSKSFNIDNNTITAFQAITKRKLSKRKFWALKDINISFGANDRIALIGSNGSGKTTLLRIIAKIFEPTLGSVNIEGKVAAFLQTDVALESELSTIDNIHILAGIYGISRKCLSDKIDEILNYAELKEFANSPVRELSSGMAQRLIMSLIRYVDADILLFDEIFESGDDSFKAKFYRTFLGKDRLKDRIIIISSHDSSVIKKFCNKAVLLEKGRIKDFGKLESVIKKYKTTRL